MPATTVARSGLSVGYLEKGKAVLTESLESIRRKMTLQTAYLGVLSGSVVFAFALFLPWASIPAGLQASDGGSSSGWNEAGWLAYFPVLIPVVKVAMGYRPVRLSRLMLCILATFGLLAFDNINGRTQWIRPFRAIDRNNIDFGANYGSSLDVGFWLGLLSLVAVAISLIAWTLHRSADVKVSPITV